MSAFNEIVTEILGELWEILPFFVAGIALEAYLRTKKWHIHIRKTLKNYGFVAVVLATLVGLISPLCACGILPLTISMILGGLPLAPAMSLLIVSPLMSPAGYSLAVKNLGPFWANAEVVAALFMGIYAGLIVHFLEKRGFKATELFKRELPKGDFHDADYPEEILRCACNDMFSKKVEASGGGPVRIFLAKMWEGGVRVGKYILLGITVAAVLKHFVPEAWLNDVLTSTNPGVILLMTVGASFLHVTQVMAVSFLYPFMEQGVSPAAGMALLIGGPVTAIPAMVMFLTLFKQRVFWLYIGLCISGTVIVSTLFQLIAK